MNRLLADGFGWILGFLHILFIGLLIAANLNGIPNLEVNSIALLFGSIGIIIIYIILIGSITTLVSINSYLKELVEQSKHPSHKESKQSERLEPKL
jgi:hypothetical protein